MAKFIKTAYQLHCAVIASAVAFKDLVVGDYITITHAEADSTGFVDTVTPYKKTATITLFTDTGKSLVAVSDETMIHLIKKADMGLNLRKHHDYIRETTDSLKDTHQNDGRPVLGPVADCEKSELPASKISLNLSKKINIPK